MSNVKNGLIVAAGAGGVGAKVAMAGVPAAALGGAAVIASTGGAAAVVLAGYGAFKWLSSGKKDKR